MLHHFKSNIGRLRIIGLLEGSSLLLLIFIAVPMKHFWGKPIASQILGPVHGAFFLLYVINALSVAVAQDWKFSTYTWKVLLACIVPLGTFYIDRKLLSKMHSTTT